MAADASNKRMGKIYPNPNVLLSTEGRARLLEKRARFEPSKRRLKVRFLLPDGGDGKQKKTATHLDATLPSICELATFNTNMKRQETVASAAQTNHYSEKPCSKTRWQGAIDVAESTNFKLRDSRRGQRKGGVNLTTQKRAPKCSIQDICDETSRYTISTDHKLSVLLAHETSHDVMPHGIRKCAIKELCIDTTRCKMPEDYREPSKEEKFKRIMNWLRESQEALPTYKQRIKKIM